MTTMTAKAFIDQLQKAGIETIARFIDETPEETTQLAIFNQLTERLDETYAQMPNDELLAFETELTRNTTSAKAPIWAEIRYDHHEETDGFIVASVDAWLTSLEDDDEDGRVIAQVVGAIINGKPSTYVVHCDPEARFDENAKEAIAACELEVKAALAEANN